MVPRTQTVTPQQKQNQSKAKIALFISKVIEKLERTQRTGPTETTPDMRQSKTLILSPNVY